MIRVGPVIRTSRLRLAPLLLLLAALASAATSGCVVVPKNRRRYLADPTMLPAEDSLEAKARDKLHTTREAAAGGNGQPAGGGCACGN